MPAVAFSFPICFQDTNVLVFSAWYLVVIHSPIKQSLKQLGSFSTYYCSWLSLQSTGVLLNVISIGVPHTGDK